MGMRAVDARGESGDEMASTQGQGQRQRQGQAAKNSKKSKAQGDAVSREATRRKDWFVTVRKLVADTLDLALPGSVMGWVRLGTGPVSLAMLGSTLLTGWEVWDRVGAEMKVSPR